MNTHKFAVILFIFQTMADSVGPLSVAAGALTALAAGAATYYIATRVEPNCVPPVDLSTQSDVYEVC